MLKHRVLLLTLFICVSGWGQDSLRNRFFISASASPDHCFARFSQDKQYYRSKWGSSYDINVGYNMKHFSFSIGFDVSNTGFVSKDLDSIYFFSDYSYYRFKRDTVMKWGAGQIAYPDAKVNYTYKFYGVPVMLYHGVRLQSKLILNAGVGVQVNWIVKAAYVLSSNNKEIIHYDLPVRKDPAPLSKGTTTFRHFPYLTGIIRIGVGYDVTNRVRVNIDPAFRYTFQDVPYYGATVNCWSVGVNAGLTYFLN